MRVREHPFSLSYVLEFSAANCMMPRNMQNLKPVTFAATLLEIALQLELVAIGFAGTPLFLPKTPFSWTKTALFGCPADNEDADDDGGVSISLLLCLCTSGELVPSS